MKKKSKFLRVNEWDLLKGLIVAILTSGLTALYNLLQAGTIVGKEQWIGIATAGTLAGIAYILKNVFENSSGLLLNTEKNV